MSEKRRYEVKFWCYGERHARYVTVNSRSHMEAIKTAMARENLIESQFYNVESERLK